MQPITKKKNKQKKKNQKWWDNSEKYETNNERKIHLTKNRHTHDSRAAFVYASMRVFKFTTFDKNIQHNIA